VPKHKSSQKDKINVAVAVEVEVEVEVWTENAFSDFLMESTMRRRWDKV
jgi:hypothetical protein